MWRQASEITCPSVSRGSPLTLECNAAPVSWLIPASAPHLDHLPPNASLLTEVSTRIVRGEVTRGKGRYLSHTRNTPCVRATTKRARIGAMLTSVYRVARRGGGSPAQPAATAPSATGEPRVRHCLRRAGPLRDRRLGGPSRPRRPRARTHRFCRAHGVGRHLQRPAVDRHRPGARDARRPAAATDGDDHLRSGSGNRVPRSPRPAADRGRPRPHVRRRAAVATVRGFSRGPSA